MYEMDTDPEAYGTVLKFIQGHRDLMKDLEIK